LIPFYIFINFQSAQKNSNQLISMLISSSQ
jgi:hypothetical protein